VFSRGRRNEHYKQKAENCDLVGQNILPDIFEEFNACYLTVTGRMTARQIEDRVIGLIRVWEQWSLYPPQYLTGLEATFQRKPADLEDQEVDAMPDEAIDLESLQRKARLVSGWLRKVVVLTRWLIVVLASCDTVQSGISQQGTGKDILKKLNYVKRFTKVRGKHVNSFKQG
jgi:hypothetical protein